MPRKKVANDPTKWKTHKSAQLSGLVIESQRGESTARDGSVRKHIKVRAICTPEFRTHMRSTRNGHELFQFALSFFSDWERTDKDGDVQVIEFRILDKNLRIIDQPKKAQK